MLPNNLQKCLSEAGLGNWPENVYKTPLTNIIKRPAHKQTLANNEQIEWRAWLGWIVV